MNTTCKRSAIYNIRYYHTMAIYISYIYIAIMGNGKKYNIIYMTIRMGRKKTSPIVLPWYHIDGLCNIVYYKKVIYLFILFFFPNGLSKQDWTF
jgi:hypothetical protein